MLKSLYDDSLSEARIRETALSWDQANTLFDYFKNQPLFKWYNFQNDCEDRANALCMLLDHWNIPNYKAWVFSGTFLNRNTGSLRNLWKFHVAPLIALKEGDQQRCYIIDPATLESLDTLEAWAEKVTEDFGSAHFITESDIYIFTPGKLKAEHWFRRNRQNYKWTIQGLAGINGVSAMGKAHLCFRKPLIAATERDFRRLMQEKPSFLSS